MARNASTSTTTTTTTTPTPTPTSTTATATTPTPGTKTSSVRKPRATRAKATTAPVETTLPVTVSTGTEVAAIETETVLLSDIVAEVSAAFETALPIGPDGQRTEAAETLPTTDSQIEIGEEMVFVPGTFNASDRKSYSSPKVVADNAAAITTAYPTLLKALKPFVRTTIQKFMTEAIVSGEYEAAQKLAVLSNALSAPTTTRAPKTVDYDLWVAERIVALVLAADAMLTGAHSPSLAGADQPADLSKVAEHVARLTGGEDSTFSSTLTALSDRVSEDSERITTLAKKLATERIAARAAHAKLAAPIYSAVSALTTEENTWITPREIFTWGAAGNCPSLPNGFSSEGAVVARINDGNCTIEGLASRASSEGVTAAFKLAE